MEQATQIVLRWLAPNAPSSSIFPNVPISHHLDGCVKCTEMYTCSCGLLLRLQEAGHFVKYEVKLSDPESLPDLDLEKLLFGLKEKSAAVDIVAFNKY